MSVNIQTKIEKLVLAPPMPLGYEAQKVFDPITVERLSVNATHFKQAAVLCTIVLSDIDPYLLLIRRAIHPKDKHSGQISFPGGKSEEIDGSLRQTALREANEEIGIDLKNVQLLVDLTEVIIPTSEFVVYPYLAVHQGIPKLAKDPSEVSEILNLPIQDLLNPDKIAKGNIALANGNIVENIIHFDFGSYKVWGATAMILSEIKALLQ